ncbi:ligase-associated DNA damage response endonuclease PdeM [Taibaiella koreensis]|uniref:ligase-associated DNA damage response endonuclease PdeM n=1 Tax=Taibaiella koreensis TaxID=1268548 RepID=UPI000E599A67|nr:ligase-associated DNA damage response endonuclease PdeM [Taibaiella koreensis]
MEIVLGNAVVELLSQRALFLPQDRILVIADLHLGKGMHFRKAGIFMPRDSGDRDYAVLHELMQRYRPRQVWFLGDLFHSAHNSDWLLFEAFILTYPDVRFVLIRGNHDILAPEHYAALSLDVVPERLELDDLVFSHEPLEHVAPGKINVAGHIHPGCLLRGLGRQSVRLPCFYLYEQVFLLPAFGALTGLYMMERTKRASIFAILPGRIVLL